MNKLRKSCIRYQIIIKHTELVKNGDYLAAKTLLELLRRQHIAVGLNDVGYTVETFLEGIGLRATYSHTYCTAYFKL